MNSTSATSTTRDNAHDDEQYATIISWNVQGLRTAKPDLELVVKEHQPLVICLQETMSHASQQPIISGYKVFNRPRQNSRRASGGILIAVSNTLESEEIETNSTLEALIVKVGPPISTNILNVYLPPNESNVEAEIRSVINTVSGSLLLVGDLNAHHPLWGSASPCRRGIQMADVFECCNLTVLNNGDPTYISHTSGARTHIDIAACSTQLTGQLDWAVLEDTHGSDHFPTIVSFPREVQQHRKRVRWVIEKANWEEFQANVNFETKEHPEEQIREITRRIIDAAKNCIPETSQHRRRKRMPWWNDTVAAAIKPRRKALRRWKAASFSDPNYQRLFQEFKSARTEARKVTNEAKSSSWKAFVKKFDSQTSTKELWNNYRRIQGKQNSTQIGGITYNNINATTNFQIAESLALAFESISSDSSYTESFRNHKQKVETKKVIAPHDQNAAGNGDLTFEELESALHGLSGSCPGEDNVHYGMICNLPQHCKTKLLHAYNRLWTKGIYPEHWKKSIVIPIYKGKGPKTDPLNYRPIYLNSCLAKVLERMVNNRLTHILECKNLLHHHQYGFRKGRSTIDHLTKLDETIRRALNSNKFSEVVFLDIHKAYDTTWKRLVLQKLCDWGIGGRMYTFIQESLQNRSFRVLANGELSDGKIMNNGLCQGSVLSVTLFLIAINTIVEQLPEDVTCLIYADDVVIVADGNTHEEVEGKLQNALNTISRWQEKTGYKISAEKCASMLFKPRYRRKPKRSSLQLNEVNIPSKKTYKCLGVTFDCGLRFTKHIEEVRASCQQRLIMLRTVANQSWGGDRAVIARLYKATILEKMLYAAPILSGATSNVISRLENLHTAGLRIIIGAFYTSPVKSLHAESGIPTLQELIKQRTAIQAIKVQARTHPEEEMYIRSSEEDTPSSDEVASSGELWNRPQNTTSQTVQERGKDILASFGLSIPLLNPDTKLTTAPWERKRFLIDKALLAAVHETDNPHELRAQFNRQISTRYRIHQCIYTDGSRKDGKCGYSVVSEGLVIRKRIYDFGGIFAAESMAVTEALKWIANQQRVGAYTICTDSLSVVTALENPIIKDKWKDTMASLHNQCVSSGKEVVFIWIPSHVGISGNERADAEAKTALTNPIDPQIRPEIRQMKTTLKNCILDKWQEQWHQIQENKLREIKNTVAPYKYAAKTRKENVILARLRIGHSLATHQHLLERKEAPRCEKCNGILSIKHLLVNCPGLEEERKKINLPTSMRETLADSIESIEKVLNYVKTIGMFEKI